MLYDEEEETMQVLAGHNSHTQSDLTHLADLLTGTKTAAFKRLPGTTVRVLSAPTRLAPLYPHVWVEKLEDNSIGGVIAGHRSATKDMTERAEVRSPFIKLLFAHSQHQFEEWLRTVANARTLIPAMMWQLGHRIAEGMLLLLCFAQRSVRGMEKARGDIEEQWSKQTIDYHAIVKTCEALPNNRPYQGGRAGQSNGRGTDFRGRGRGGRGRFNQGPKNE